MAYRIPTDLSGFGDYLQTVDLYLNAPEPGGTAKRGESLGMVSAELTQLQTFSKQWSTGDLSDPGVYDLHRNPDTKTKKTRKDVEKLIKDFKTFFMPLLNIMEVSRNITSGDRLVLRIAEPVTSHGHRITPIAESCNASVKAMGGGDMKVDCRVTHDASRPSLPEGADGVEIAFVTVWPDTSKSMPAELSGKVKSILTGPGDGTTKMIFTKASFLLRLGAENSGATLQFFVRWINTKRPELAGQWTGPYSITIS
jgi:hypothetical protein